MWFFAFIVSAAGGAWCAAEYASTGRPLNLGAAIFCGALAVFDLVMAVKDR